ncbi:hypothetical protein [Dapis sp. BLCC M229]|uniref:hypothetical protein n=1 Tax=Dapis sp. BLCC M229 TaxID=3400188 RepID=UPI003CF97ED0
MEQKVDLHYQSISELDIGKQFDVAYSRGGAWFMLVDDELKKNLWEQHFEFSRYSKKFLLCCQAS